MILQDIAPILREKVWQDRVVALALVGGWKTYHTYRSERSDRGFPDLVIIRERVIFAELKTNTGTCSNEQAGWLWLLKNAGLETYLWRPRDEAKVEAVLTFHQETSLHIPPQVLALFDRQLPQKFKADFKKAFLRELKET
jgi:hypothetical protein